MNISLKLLQYLNTVNWASAPHTGKVASNDNHVNLSVCLFVCHNVDDRLFARGRRCNNHALSHDATMGGDLTSRPSGWYICFIRTVMAAVSLCLQSSFLPFALKDCRLILKYCVLHWNLSVLPPISLLLIDWFLHETWLVTVPVCLSCTGHVLYIGIYVLTKLPIAINLFILHFSFTFRCIHTAVFIHFPIKIYLIVSYLSDAVSDQLTCNMVVYLCVRFIINKQINK